MATIGALKPKVQQCVRPLAGRLVRAGATANGITIAAIVVSAAYGAFLATGYGGRAALAVFPIIVAVRIALNALDGIMAREYGQESRLGAYLNELGDVIADACLYLPFALMAPAGWLVVPVVLAGCLVEFAGVLAQLKTGLRRTDGPFGKGDRTVFFCVMALILANWPLGPVPTALVWGGALAAGIATIINRLSEPRNV